MGTAKEDLTGGRVAVMTQKSFYPKLLLRNYCLLAFLAGIMAFRHIYPGLIVLILLLLLSAAHGKRLAGALLLCLVFGLGFGLGVVRSPEQSPEPTWLLESMGGDNAHQRPQTLYVQGRVKEVETYSDGRIRLLLSDVLPLAPLAELQQQYERHTPALRESLETAEPYAGNIAVTLWESQHIPLSGQTIRLNARFARVRGFANPGVFTIDDYWRDREVWVRGWNVRGKSAVPLVISGKADFFASVRHGLWQDFVQALPGMGEGQIKQVDSQVSPIFSQKQSPTLQESVDTPSIPQGLASLQGTGAVFLPALIFADRSGFTPYQKDLLAKATLTHSMALSGLHLGYVGLVGVGLALLISKLFPAILLYLPRPKLCFILTVPLALGYLWIGGAPLSLVRSAVMLFFFGLVLFGNGAKTLMDGLFAAVFLIVLLWPWALFDLSLQLSALSVGAIALFLPLIHHAAHKLIPASLGGHRDYKESARFGASGGSGNYGGHGYHDKYDKLGNIGSIAYFGSLEHWAKGTIRTGLILLLMSCSIQLTLAPLLVQVFGAMGLWFPLNLVWLPVLGLVVMPLTLGAFGCVSIGWSFGARLLLYGASLPCDALMWLLQRMDEAGYLVAPLAMRPHWLAIMGLWAVAILLPYILWKKWQGVHTQKRMPKSFYFAVMGCAAGTVLAVGITAQAWHRYNTQELSLAVLDVGQGQSVVLTWPGGRALVDGGGFFSKTFDVGKMVVAPYLTHQRPARVDWLINSHPDYDHLGGMLHILESFAVTQGFAGNGDVMTGTLLEEYERIAIRNPRFEQHVWQAGDVISLWSEEGGAGGAGVRLVEGEPYGESVSGQKSATVSENGLTLEVLWPPEKSLGDGLVPQGNGKSHDKGKSAGKQDIYTGNDASLVLRLVWKGRGLALLCGDIGKKGLRGLLAITAPEALQAEVLVLPHHGSKSSFSKELYEVVHPNTVLVSCGYKNVWGFPHADVRRALQEMEMPLYSTAEHGMVKVSWPDKEKNGLVELTRP